MKFKDETHAQAPMRNHSVFLYTMIRDVRNNVAAETKIICSI